MPPFSVTLTIETHYDVVVQAEDANAAERIAIARRGEIQAENQPRAVDAFVDGVSEISALSQAPKDWAPDKQPYASRGGRPKALADQGLPAELRHKPSSGRLPMTPNERHVLGDRVGPHEDCAE